MTSRADVLYLSHGGGPLPLLGDPGHRDLVEGLQAMATQMPTPAAILVISAHWEESAPTVTTGAAPALIYDYYGFPPESYEITYPCPGHPALATAIHQALVAAGLPAQQDAERGFDHGLFVPLKLMYPQANIPCVQLSLLDSLDPQAHLAMGRALQALDMPGLLVIGSGFSFHNMRAFFTPETAEIRAANQAFEAWLKNTCSDPSLTESARQHRLAHWAEAPHARFCHPREEHLLPLHVCQGLAGRACDRHVSMTVLGKQASLMYWQGASNAQADGGY